MKFLKLYLKNLAILLLTLAALIIFCVGIRLAISYMGDKCTIIILISTVILGLALGKTIEESDDSTEESK